MPIVILSYVGTARMKTPGQGTGAIKQGTTVPRGPARQILRNTLANEVGH